MCEEYACLVDLLQYFVHFGIFSSFFYVGITHVLVVVLGFFCS